jgi:hypothetical protein
MNNNEKELMRKILNCYVGLSPENLWMDGEATAAQANYRAKQLNNELEVLFKKLGRKVSEQEAYTFHYNEDK